MAGSLAEPATSDAMPTMEAAEPISAAWKEKKNGKERPQSHVIIFIRRIIILRCVKINKKRREGENDGDEKLEIRL